MPDVPQSQAVHFGKYLLDRELARGGMSRVFGARLRGPGGFEKKLVVKQILPELAREPGFVELFVKEANTLVQMSHPGVVPVYELGVIEGVYFLAMERIEGATVAELLRNGPLPAAMVAQIGAEIAEALRYAHERFQIVHRDVTTRNVIVDDAGHARLLDFGIAAPVELTGRTGELFGSPGYMAPEQLRGEPLGPESDLFSLGAVLYEAVSGGPALAKLREPSDLPYTEPPALEDLDPVLGALISRMLGADRRQRPQLASEVATTLRTWLSEHHPSGIEHDLAERARRAHAERERDDGGRSTRNEPTATAVDEPRSGPIAVQSIATSPVLAALLEQATERIERPMATATPEPNADALADPEARATIRRFARDIVVITLALVVAIYWANHYPLGRHEAEADVVRTAPSAPAPRAPTSALTEPEAAAAPTPSAAVGAALVEATATEPAATKLGSLTVNAVPWADVRVGARALGVTPRRNVSLPAGKYVLALDCPPLGRHAKVPVQLRPGEALQVLVDMQVDPPRVSVR